MDLQNICPRKGKKWCLKEQVQKRLRMVLMLASQAWKSTADFWDV